MTKTPKQGFILGVVWSVLAVAQWVLLAIDSDGWRAVVLHLFAGIGTTLLAAAYLTSAELLRRRRRAGGEPEAERPSFR